MSERYDNSYRLQQRFWLDVSRPIENELANYIDILKEKRSFTGTIRDALRLIKDLRQGSTRVLLMLFPWVRDQIEAEVRAALTEPRQPDLHPVLEAHMARLEKLLAEQTSMPRAPDIPRALSAPMKAETPELTVTVAAGDGKRATQNFMRSLMAIQTSYKKDAPVQAMLTAVEGAKGMTSSTASGNPKKLEVPSVSLEPPTLDDDLDDLLTITS